MNLGISSLICEEIMKYLILAVFVLFLVFVLFHTYMVVNPFSILLLLAVSMTGSFYVGRWTKRSKA